MGRCAHPGGRFTGPSPIGDALMLEALRACGGPAVAVPEEEINEAQCLAGRLGAGYVGPETAAALAAAAALRRSGHLEPNERIVVFDTGIGHKSPPPPDLPIPPTVTDDETALQRILQQPQNRPTPLQRSGGEKNSPRSPRWFTQ